jgi:hypothetical protein
LKKTEEIIHFPRLPNNFLFMKNLIGVFGGLGLDWHIDLSILESTITIQSFFDMARFGHLDLSVLIISLNWSILKRKRYIIIVIPIFVVHKVHKCRLTL